MLRLDGCTESLGPAHRHLEYVKKRSKIKKNIYIKLGLDGCIESQGSAHKHLRSKFLKIEKVSVRVRWLY